jgi:hypothetical protein
VFKIVALEPAQKIQKLRYEKPNDFEESFYNPHSQPRKNASTRVYYTMHRQSIRYLGIISILGLFIFVGAFLVIAEPEYTAECGGCHTISSSWSMSSNSTGLAQVGVPFTLRINASKPSFGGINFYLSVQNGWADNDQFNFTPTYVLDNSAGDLTPANFLITHEFTFTPLSSGNLTIRAWTSSSSASQFIDIPIDVTNIPDETSPIIDSPVDIDYAVSTIGHNITWTPFDEHPLEYNIQINGVVVISGGWNGQPIVINIDYLSPGTYEYTLTVIDVGGNTASDTVMVNVTGEITTTTSTTTTTGTTTTPVGNPSKPGDNDKALTTASFSLIMLSMGIIVGILILILSLDRWRS